MAGRSRDLGALTQKKTSRLLNEKVSEDVSSMELSFTLHLATASHQVLLMTTVSPALVHGPAPWPLPSALSPSASSPLQSSPSQRIKAPASPSLHWRFGPPAPHLHEPVGQPRVQRQRSPTLGAKHRDKDRSKPSPLNLQPGKAPREPSTVSGVGQREQRDLQGQQLMGRKADLRKVIP